MFVEFKNARSIWHLIEQYIYKTIKIKVSFGTFDILFGYHVKNQNQVPINVIILITKKYIYDINSRNNVGSIHSIEGLKHKFQQAYQDELYLAIITNRKKKFEIVWNTWIPVFSVTNNVTD